MLNQLFRSSIRKGLVIALQVGLCRLRAVANGLRLELVEITGWVGLIKVRAKRVNAHEQHANAIRAATRRGGRSVALLGELLGEAADWVRLVVNVAVVQAFSPKPGAEDAGIGGEAGNRYSETLVYLEYFLLVGGKL